MELELKNYYKYKRDLELMLTGPGLWPNYHKYSYNFKISLNLFAIFTTCVTSYGLLMFCIKNAANIIVMTKGLSLFISLLTAFFKVFILMMHQKDLEYLSDNVSTDFERNLKISEYRQHLLAHSSMFSKFFYVLNYFVFASILLLVVMPLAALRHGKYLRMFPQVLPFSYEPGGTIHWIIYGFEIISGLHLWTVTSGSDSLFGLFTLHIVGELRLLSYNFQKLKSSDNYKNDLKSCISKHTVLIKSKIALERTFGFLAIWLAVSCAICMCALVFQLTATKSFTVFKICYSIFYVLLKLVQAYSYAWFGNIINVESRNCLDSMYRAEWLGSGDIKFMSDVLIVLSQKPLIFKAKSLMILEMDMFTKIVNTTVSYFFLLQTLEESLEESS